MIDEKNLKKVKINEKNNDKSEDLNSKTTLNPIKNFITDHKFFNMIKLNLIKIERNFIKRTKQQKKNNNIGVYKCQILI